MDTSDYKYKLFNDTSFEDCIVSFVGTEVCTPGYSYGPAVRPCYIIHYILNGQGKFFCNNKEHCLKKGDIFLIEPDIMTFYQADFCHPWAYAWIGLRGKKLPEFFQRIGINYIHPILHLPDNNRVEEILRQILHTDSSGMKQEFTRQSLLFDFFEQISPSSTHEMHMAQSNDIRDNNYLVKAIEFIQNNYHNYIRVTDVSEHLGITRNYLFTIFKNSLGHSPHDYISYYKLSKARHLLDDSNYTIENVAFSCGYDELSTFSRAFKKRYGVTPSGYRKFRYEHSELSTAELTRYLKKMKE